MSLQLQSISPIDGAVVWSGSAATTQQVQSAIDNAFESQRAWNAVPMQRRVEIVQRYGKLLQDNRQELADLITREVGKLRWDAKGEVAAAIAKVDLSIQALQQRRSDQVVGETTDTDPESGKEVTVLRKVRNQPLGVALVLGPFNFPLHLPGGQIIPALLAGNGIVFKPSEQATGVAHWMLEAWRQAGLPEGVMQLIPGGVDTAVAAIDSPLVTGVFLTGSREAGRAIHRQLAGRYDVLLALELGGNNPVVIAADAAPDLVGAVASFSAFVSSGQRCTCARRAIFVNGDETDLQIESLLERARKLTAGMPDSIPAPQLGPLISESAAKGLHQTYEKLLALGCRVLVPLGVDADFANVVRPGIVDATGIGDASLKLLGELEWFGPLLVIQRVESFEEAVNCASETPYGLAASLLGGTQEMFNTFVGRVQAGIVNWNGATTGAAGTMPFGGLGDSGNHRPAGYYAIDFCCDPVASIERDSLSQPDPWRIAQ